MPVAARQCGATLTDDWLTVEEAAALTGETERTWQRRAQWEAKQARIASRPSLAVRRTPESGGKPVWHVRRSIDARLTRFPEHATRDDRQRPALLTKHPENKVQQAYRKLRWLDEWRKLCEGRGGATEAELAERIVADAKRAEGDDFPISFRALQLWRRAYNAEGPDGQIRRVEALIDRRGAEPAGVVGKVKRSQEAIDHFYCLFRTENKLSLAACHRMTLAEAKRRGWDWPTTIAATHKWNDRHDDIAFTYLCRYGKRAYSKKYMPYAEQDWSAIAAGEFYVADHTQCDFWCLYKDDLIRPWLTAVLDCRSRCIVGWHLGPKPHQEAILSALYMAFDDWGIPRTLRIDNGRDFQARTFTGLTKREARELRRVHGKEWRDVVRRQRDTVALDDPRWMGIFEELEVRQINANPYAPWSKGQIERWFGTFEDQCGKLFVTYCGNEPKNRPECLPDVLRGRRGIGGEALQAVDASDVPTLDQVRGRIADYLLQYHEQPHAGVGIENATPRETWAIDNAARTAEREALTCMMSIRGEYTVGRNGVSVRLGGRTFGYGARSAALRRYMGRKVLVSVAPDRPADCSAFECQTRRLIGVLEANKRIHPAASTDDVREAIAEVNRERKDMRRAYRGSARRTRTAVERANADAAQRVSPLRATGTDDRQANIRPARTGFEGQSMPVQTAFDSIPEAYRNVVLSDEQPGDLSDLLSDEAPLPDPDWDCSDLLLETPRDDGGDGRAAGGDLLSDRTDAEAGEDTLAAFDE
jgi:transposase InsO family protein